MNGTARQRAAAAAADNRVKMYRPVLRYLIEGAGREVVAHYAVVCRGHLVSACGTGIVDGLPYDGDRGVARLCPNCERVLLAGELQRGERRVIYEADLIIKWRAP